MSMFGSIKKWFAVAAAVTALAVPSLALADDHGAQRAPRRDDKVLVQVRADAGPSRVDRDRDERRAKWHHRREPKRHDRDDRRDGDHRCK
jgi:hypothetical protein